VRWRTDLATDSRVRFGPSPGLLTSTVSDATATTEHELRLAGPGVATWDGNDEAGRRSPPGVYFAILRFDGAKRVVRVVIDR
jgi:hypothetical protein